MDNVLMFMNEDGSFDSLAEDEALARFMMEKTPENDKAWEQACKDYTRAMYESMEHTKYKWDHLSHDEQVRLTLVATIPKLSQKREGLSENSKRAILQHMANNLIKNK